MSLGVVAERDAPVGRDREADTSSAIPPQPVGLVLRQLQNLVRCFGPDEKRDDVADFFYVCDWQPFGRAPLYEVLQRLVFDIADIHAWAAEVPQIPSSKRIHKPGSRVSNAYSPT